MFTLSTRSRASIFIALWLALPVTGSSAETYAPRVEFGARLEPGNRIIHGAGQDARGFSDYARCFDGDHQPLIYMTYVSLRKPLAEIAAWGTRLERELAQHSPAKPIPQIGLNLTGGNDNGSSLDMEISEGKFDAQIQAFADALASLGRPVFIRIGYEFDGKWNNYQPATFQLAWKRITRMLRERNLPFAAVWCAAGGSSGWPSMARLMEFYPGDEFVDWWGVDVFSANEINHSKLETFLDASRNHRKPVMIGEMTPRHSGVLGGQQSWDQWFGPMIDLLKRRPEIKATAYINWEWREQSDRLGFKWHNWGDARIERNDLVRDRWVEELSNPIYLQARRDGSIPLSPITVTRDATASLKTAFKDRFPVGVAINRSHATGQNTGRRNLEQIGREVALIKAQFNQITAENDMKWQHIHPREGADGYAFGPADAFVGFGGKHGLERVGHALVWHNQTPDWVFAGTIPPPQSANPPNMVSPGNFRPVYPGPRASREELLARMRDHIHKVVGRYKGKVKTWDVVNEALADGPPEMYLRDSLWRQIIGPDFIAKAFQYAHEADPGAILRYNDFGLENPVKIQKLARLIKSLQEQNVPVHAIGTQAHLNLDSASFERMDRSLAEIAKLGLPIHVTELDIHGGNHGDQKLALAYEGVFRAIMKHRDSVKMVTFWGVNDAVSWLRDGRPLLFDGECKPKPAFDAVMRAAKELSSVSHDLTPLHDATRVLENPHKGWYHHFPDNHPNKYQIARDADLLEFPGMDHLYIRLAWAYLEPEEGRFDWAVIDRIIEKWTAHGLGIAFRISCKETGTDRIEQQYATPRWVRDAGARGGHYIKGKPAGPEAPWEPEYDDPVFLAKLEKFLAAFAARYDGKPWVRYVDIGSIGDWGEGHSWAGSRKVLSFAVRKAHIDLHLKVFKHAQLIISDDYVHALPDAAERETLHRHILANGISYRDDSILVDGYFSNSSERFTVRSPEFFSVAYSLKPTVLELEHYGKVKSLGNWEPRSGSAAFKFGKGKTGADFLRGALGLLHATYIGYHGDAREWLNDNPDLTNELLNRCGYWLFPVSLDLPSTVTAGSATPFRLTINNRGVAPPYHPYELRVKLSGGGASWMGSVGRAARSWLPGAPIIVQNQLDLPADLKPGRYAVSLGLFDGSRPVEFALRASLRQSDGYYRVAEIEVEGRE